MNRGVIIFTAEIYRDDTNDVDRVICDSIRWNGCAANDVRYYRRCGDFALCAGVG